MAKQIRRIEICSAILIALVLGGAIPGHGQTSGAAFLIIPTSPRAYSMGQSEAVAALGAQAIGANPANLGLMTHSYELFTSYASAMDNGQYGHIAAAFSTPSLGLVDSLGLSVTRFQINGLQ